MSCDDLCTAAKCRELENRIGALEQALELLEASFEAHTQQEIPEAHNYDSNIRIDGSYQSNMLTLTVADKTNQDTATIQIPDSNVTVSLATSNDDNTLKVFVAVGSENDDETITLPEPNVEVSLAANSDDRTLKVFVKVGNKSDDEIVTLPKEDPLDWLDLLGDLLKTLLLDQVIDAVKDLIRDAIDKAIEELFDLLRDYIDDLLKATFLSISSDYSNQNLQICVSNSLGSDCTSVRIPRGGGGGSGGGEDDTEDYLSGNGNLTDEGILQISINSSIGSANIQIDMGLAELERLVEEIHEYTVIDIEGQTPTAFLCPETEETEEPVEVEPALLPYTGKGLAGLHELAKTFNDNLLTIFSEICQLEIDPITSFPEGWQIKKGENISQLAIIFRPEDKNNKSGNYLTHIPHYNGSSKPNIPSYRKGDFWARWRLADNSHIIVFASSKAESIRVIRNLERYVKPSFRTNETPWLVTGQASTGTYKTLKVKPVRADYYPKGKEELIPQWRYYFKNEQS